MSSYLLRPQSNPAIFACDFLAGRSMSALHQTERICDVDTRSYTTTSSDYSDADVADSLPSEQKLTSSKTALTLSEYGRVISVAEQLSNLSVSNIFGNNLDTKILSTIFSIPVTPDSLFCLPDLETLPHNFGIVSSGSIYRCAFPQPENIPFLQALRLKTVLTLVNTPCSAEYTKFLEESGVKHVRHVLPSNKGEIRMTRSDMDEILRLYLLDRSKYPILIHCNKGKHRTGCVIASLRKFCRQPIPSILNEYEEFAAPKCRDGDRKFICDYEPTPAVFDCTIHSRPSQT